MQVRDGSETAVKDILDALRSLVRVADSTAESLNTSLMDDEIAKARTVIGRAEAQIEAKRRDRRAKRDADRAADCEATVLELLRREKGTIRRDVLRAYGIIDTDIAGIVERRREIVASGDSVILIDVVS